MQIKLRNLKEKQQPLFDKNGAVFLLESYRHVAALECFPDFKGEAVLVRALNTQQPWWGWFRVGEDVEIVDIGVDLLHQKNGKSVSQLTESAAGVS